MLPFLEKKTSSPEEKKIDSVNIFEDFTKDKKLEKEVSNIEQNQKKDMYYYMALSISFLKIINTFFFLFLFLTFLYIFIQNRTSYTDISVLSPICSVFIGDNTEDSCTGVSYLTSEYQKKVDDLKKTQFQKISSILPELFTTENFAFSKEVTFLLEKANNRIKPLQILKEFDDLKNKFEPIEKTKIQCSNLKILEESTFEITCNAFSSDWDKQIVGFSGNKSETNLEGTSITIANSLINFLTKTKSNFQVLEAQKVFSAQQGSQEQSIYTKKTAFQIVLKYESNSF